MKGIREYEEKLIELKKYVEVNPRKKELEDHNMDINSKVSFNLTSGIC